MSTVIVLKIVASNNYGEARSLLGNGHGEVALFDVSDVPKLDEMISRADVVVSLLPANLHPVVAERCIARSRHLVTASYISPQMRALHDQAGEADVLLLNEIGLDPGLDHCSARALVSRAGGKPLAFASFCGGLPAPDSAGNSGGLLYKVSWSARGALAAMRRGARFKLGGTMFTLPGEELLASGHYVPSLAVPGAETLAFEGIANGDGASYARAYGLGRLSELRTIIRGTLRYRGFSDTMHAFKVLGMLGDEERERIVLNGGGWHDFLRQCVERQVRRRVGDAQGLRSAIRDLVGTHVASSALETFEWLGLLPSDSREPDFGVPGGAHTPIDLLALLLGRRLQYEKHERDMVVLAHELATNREVWTSSLVVYGEPGGTSAMARTVGMPVACATLRVLDGRVSARGVCGPDIEEVWRGILTDVAEAGLVMHEHVRPSSARMGLMEAGLTSAFEREL